MNALEENQIYLLKRLEKAIDETRALRRLAEKIKRVNAYTGKKEEPDGVLTEKLKVVIDENKKLKNIISSEGFMAESLDTLIKESKALAVLVWQLSAAPQKALGTSACDQQAIEYITEEKKFHNLEANIRTLLKTTAPIENDSLIAPSTAGPDVIAFFSVMLALQLMLMKLQKRL